MILASSKKEYTKFKESHNCNSTHMVAIIFSLTLRIKYLIQINHFTIIFPKFTQTQQKLFSKRKSKQCFLKSIST